MDDMDVDDGNDYDETEDLVNNVLGNDDNDDECNAVTDDDINSKDGGSGREDSNDKE